MGLLRKQFEVPLDGGLLTRGDERAKSAPAVERLLNAEYDDIGGLRVRYPFAGINSNIFGGGTISNCRKIFANGDEFVLFTDSALYTWQAQLSAWKLIGPHLAVTCDEAPRFTTQDDTTFTDRAELNGAVFYTWSSGTGSTAVCYVAVADKATGAVLLSPTTFGTAPVTMPRVVALDTAVLLFYVATDLLAVSISPSNPAVTAWSSPHTIIAGVGTTYDIAPLPASDYAVVVAPLVATTSYKIAKVTAGLTVTASSKARTCETAIAVAVTPDEVSAQVFRDASSVIYGDLITLSTLADVFTSTPCSGSLTGVVHLTAAYRSVKAGGQWRCYFYVTMAESGVGVGGGGDPVWSGWLDDANYGNTWFADTGVLGTSSAVDFLGCCGIASRAFEYGGSVYVWLVFAGTSLYSTGSPSVTTYVGALQNTYFLYRDDALLIAKAADNNAAGFGAVVGLLPGVALVNGTTEFAWCGTERRRVPSSDPYFGSAYAARAPLDVTFTFDDNRARRCARLGRTMYIAGGMVMAYDGTQIVELGWQAYPWNLEARAATTGTGSIADGAYGVRSTYRWDNAQGERDRSTTATTLTITITGGPQGMTMTAPCTPVTRKTSPKTAIEIWRTTVAGSVYYLSTSTDPTKTSPNQYLANGSTTLTATAAFRDELQDSDLNIREEYPAAAELPPLPPPAANVIVASDTRLFLADIAGKPDTVWYSKQRQDGQVASFNDALTFTVPSPGGRITAIAQLEAGLVVWREWATYLFEGLGFDNNGDGANYSLARVVSKTSGALSAEGVAYGDDGWFVRTNSGWYLLDKAFNYTYIGMGVYRYDSEQVLASVVLTGRTQFRVVTTARVLVFDTIVKKWTEWTIADGLDMIVDSSLSCWYLTATGPRQELTTWTGYGSDDTSLTEFLVETTWLKPDGQQQGRYVVDYLQALGEYRSDCRWLVQIAKDYEMTAPGTPNWHTTKTWTPTPATDGDAVEVRTSPVKKRCAAIKMRITVTDSDGVSPLVGASLRLTSIAGQYAVEPGIYAALSSGQKQ